MLECEIPAKRNLFRSPRMLSAVVTDRCWNHIAPRPGPAVTHPHSPAAANASGSQLNSGRARGVVCAGNQEAELCACVTHWREGEIHYSPLPYPTSFHQCKHLRFNFHYSPSFHSSHSLSLHYLDRLQWLPHPSALCWSYCNDSCKMHEEAPPTTAFLGYFPLSPLLAN
jgi:hypothetical protein